MVRDEPLFLFYPGANCAHSILVVQDLGPLPAPSMGTAAPSFLRWDLRHRVVNIR